jgi:hypothetical protein
MSGVKVKNEGKKEDRVRQKPELYGDRTLRSDS